MIATDDIDLRITNYLSIFMRLHTFNALNLRT